MSEERLQEIKDSINLQYQVQEANDLHNFNIFTDEEQELVEEIERLNNIINELEKWIKENNLGKYRTENVIDTDELLNKLQELKGDGSDE